MIVSSHQPNFIPWIGFFYKIFASDIFVIADDVDYTKKSFINRNRIKTPNGITWLTVPVKKEPIGTPINKIQIADISELARMLKILESNYSKSPFFKLYIKKIDAIFADCSGLLSDLNTSLIKFVVDELNITTAIYKTSDLNLDTSTPTRRIISICKSVNSTHYLSGFGGNKYQQTEEFALEGIKCDTYQFKHPIYKQKWGEFIPNLSILDLLFNTGPMAEEIIKKI